MEGGIERPRMEDELLKNGALYLRKNVFQNKHWFFRFPHSIAHAMFKMEISKKSSRVQGWGEGCSYSVPLEIQKAIGVLGLKEN